MMAPWALMEGESVVPLCGMGGLGRVSLGRPSCWYQFSVTT